MKLKIRDSISRLRGGAERSDRTGDGSRLEQIQTLSAENRRNPDAKRERRLIRLRNEAFEELDRQAPDSAPEMLDEVPEGARSYQMSDGLPSISASELDGSVIRAAFLDAGCLLVRGLIPTARAGELAAGIDNAFNGRDAFLEGARSEKTAPWFHPYKPSDSDQARGKISKLRHVKGGGSVWAADSPRVLFDLLDAFEQVGVQGVAHDYLGERPAFSMNKAVLRRVSATAGGAWHQDGAFLGEGIRTLNIWTAMTRCGDVAPGMDIVPRRLTEIAPTGTEGALFDWDVSEQVVEELTGGEVARPIFEAGDALLFDHMCLHRTAAEPDMPEVRYATETWCFAPSSYPDTQIPLVV